MKPLTPEDLVMRSGSENGDSPISAPVWGTDAPTTRPKIEIPLERFQTLEKIVRDSPITVDPYLELARIYFDQERWQDVRRIAEMALEKFPEDDDANFLCEEAQINRSRQLFLEAKQTHDAEPTRLTLEPLERSNMELNVLREKVYEKRLARHPDKTELNLQLAEAHENLGNTDKAIARLEIASQVPELRARAAYQLGRLYERTQSITEALSAYRKAAMFRVPEPPYDLKIASLAAAANLAQKFGLIDSALRYVELLDQLQPNNAAIKKRLEELRAAPL
ncbi:MAG: tetratricopeptide repeat protein [Aureliella sp.]